MKNKDNISIALVLLGCILGLIVTLNLVPKERPAPPPTKHIHEKMPYHVRGGRATSDTVCVDLGMLIRNGKHIDVPNNLEPVVQQFFYQHIKPKL